MSVETTRARMVAVWEQITGVQHVYDNIPRVIQAAELPGVIVFPGEMDITLEASDLASDERVYLGEHT